MSTDIKSATECTTSTTAANAALSRALMDALDPPLLRPLIGLVARYAHALDWSRATVETIPFAEPVDSASAVLVVDSSPPRVVWAETTAGRMRTAAIDDLKTAITSAAPAKAVTVAHRTGGVTWPFSVAIEGPTRWPNGSDGSASLVGGQVGAGALWIANGYSGHKRCVIRIDERTGASCVVAGGGTPGFADGPGHTARFGCVTAIVWDALYERALVCDQSNGRIRAITRARPPRKGSENAKWSAWTVSTLIGGGTPPAVALRLEADHDRRRQQQQRR